ncbi:hypothetical protein F5Y15DRAFT_334184 [Xylariaceae sp. FL0016]|nr:hypothetical protein F5Y15DRAFT_334184 [Xylariaceae sp. FL0016]
MSSLLTRRPSALLALPKTTNTAQTSRTPLSHTPIRHATLIRRPRRPYTFTQIVQLSDGSTFTMRTSSPHALYKSTKDSRNHIMWQPSEKSLKNVEVDEAGKLAAFRGRFGRSWDAERATDDEGREAGGDRKQESTGDPLSDLISGYAGDTTASDVKDVKVKAKGKGGKK